MIKNLISYLYFKFVTDKESETFTTEEQLAILQEMGKVDDAIKLMGFFAQRDKDRYFVAINDSCRFFHNLNSSSF